MGDDAEPGMAESTVHLSFDRTAIECVAAAAYTVRRREEYGDAVCNALSRFGQMGELYSGILKSAFKKYDLDIL